MVCLSGIRLRCRSRCLLATIASCSSYGFEDCVSRSGHQRPTVLNPNARGLYASSCVFSTKCSKLWCLADDSLRFLRIIYFAYTDGSPRGTGPPQIVAITREFDSCCNGNGKACTKILGQLRALEATTSACSGSLLGPCLTAVVDGCRANGILLRVKSCSEAISLASIPSHNLESSTAALLYAIRSVGSVQTQQR